MQVWYGDYEQLVHAMFGNDQLCQYDTRVCKKIAIDVEKESRSSLSTPRVKRFAATIDPSRRDRYSTLCHERGHCQHWKMWEGVLLMSSKEVALVSLVWDVDEKEPSVMRTSLRALLVRTEISNANTEKMHIEV